MANNVYLADMKMLNNQLNDAADTALSAFEKDMFGGAAQEKSHVVNDAAPDSLRYLFAIFR